MSNCEFHLIDLDPGLPGHEEFLSCWVCMSGDAVFLVDPGPASGIESLAAGLKKLGIERIDLILLTHIHLDHGGAVGHLVRMSPEAKVFCHPVGRRHIIDPTRLWQGSLQVLGDVADVYGPPLPVPEESFIVREDVEQMGIGVVATPGHAPHHLSFVYENALIIGEAIGTHAPLPSPREKEIYLRPATPPRFFLEESLASIDALSRLDPSPEKILFAHYGIRDEVSRFLATGRKQLVDWVETVRDLLREGEDDLTARMHKRLLRTDPFYANFVYLEEAVRGREYMYLEHTLEGIVGYLRSNG